MSPTSVKSLICGQGRAQKFQIARIIAIELGISIPASEDASDALALALAHVYSMKSSFHLTARADIYFSTT